VELKFDARFPEINRMTGQSRVQLTVKANTNAPSFSRSEALRNALQQVPDVRQTEVARAADLVNSTQYPSDQMVQKLANLFVKHLDVPDSP
jgi:hypothetical protein